MARILNNRDRAILNWIKKNNPRLTEMLEQVIDSEGIFLPALRPFRTLHLMLRIGFDAGRKFQRDNPNASDDLDEEDNFTCV